MSGGPGEQLYGVISWVAFIVLLLFFGFLSVIWLIGFWVAWTPEIIAKHFAVVIGLPVAAAYAAGIVLAFRQTEGPIEFEFLTMKVRGAAGPVVLWVLCFLAIAAAVKLLS